MRKKSQSATGKIANPAHEKKVVAISSVFAAVFLTGIKLVVGLITGSLGIMAEAAHSALDLIAALITFFAVRVSDRPADESHLYGHGKVENLSALTETFLLFITCIWIIYEAIHRLFFVEIDVNPNKWAFIIMAISIIVDFSRSRALARVAKKHKSQALEADALHFSTDIWSSAVVIAGLLCVRFGEYRGGDQTIYEHADAIAALVVALIVIWISIKLGRRAIDALLDRAPQGLAECISRSVAGIAGIRGISRLRVRDVGNKVFVDMEIDVPRHLSFEESHQITMKAREAVCNVSPNADVTINSIPIAESEGLLEKIQATAAREHVPIHNVTTHLTERGIWIDLDLEVDPNLSFECAHEQATNLETRLKSDLIGLDGSMPVADVNAHIEPRTEESIAGLQLEASAEAHYIERIAAIQQEFKQTDGCQDIALHRMKGRIYLSFHLLIDAVTPIAEVHEIAEEMEIRLRREFPELGRVVIHTEPK